MEGDGHNDGEGGGAIEWIIRAMLLVLTLTAVWTVFGDDIGQLLGR